LKYYKNESDLGLLKVVKVALKHTKDLTTHCFISGNAGGHSSDHKCASWRLKYNSNMRSPFKKCLSNRKSAKAIYQAI